MNPEISVFIVRRRTQDMFFPKKQGTLFISFLVSGLFKEKPFPLVILNDLCIFVRSADNPVPKKS